MMNIILKNKKKNYVKPLSPIFSLQAPVCCRFFLSPYMEEQLLEKWLAFKEVEERS